MQTLREVNELQKKGPNADSDEEDDEDNIYEKGDADNEYLSLSEGADESRGSTSEFDEGPGAKAASDVERGSVSSRDGHLPMNPERERERGRKRSSWSKRRRREWTSRAVRDRDPRARVDRRLDCG